jgi:signal transduction histidine kinase
MSPQLAEALDLERTRVLTAVVAERKRLRRDLHDGLGPALAGIGLGLQAAQDELAAGNNSATEELLARLGAEVRMSVGEVRRIVDDLRPAVLDSDGLVGALRRHAATLELARPSGAPCESLMIHVDADQLPVLPPEVEVAAYRIAQESLTNVVRHADARRVHVRLLADGQTLRLEVADDGRGLGNAHTGGVGVPSMRHRAESLSGTLDLTSTERGTTVAAHLPLTKREP